MSLIGKIVIGGAGAALLGAGAYLLRLRRTASQLETVVKTNVHQINQSGITIRVDVLLKNPTRGSLKIKFPFIKLLYLGSTIGTSQAIDKDVLIPSYGQAVVDGIMIQVPAVGLISIGVDLIKGILGATAGVSVQIKTITAIDLWFKTLPYEKTQDIILKKQG